jgi:small-conductance mechanosensitive channel
MVLVVQSLRADWEALLAFAPRLFYGLVLLLVFLIAAKLAGRIAARIIHRSQRLRANERFLQLVVSWSISSVGVLLALGLMGFQGIATSLLATGGVVAIVLGFAFREIGENFLAGFFLTFSRPFELGDLIKTGDLTGVVRSIELRYVHIRTFDACDVFVPSAQMFREPLYNYTRDGLRRPSFTVGVAYHDDPEKVVALLEEVASSTTDVLAEPRAFVTVKAFAAAYVEYEVFFWLDVNASKRGYIATITDVKINCWRALRDAGFTFSTDVTTGLDINTAPDLRVGLTNQV